MTVANATGKGGAAAYSEGSAQKRLNSSIDQCASDSFPGMVMCKPQTPNPRMQAQQGCFLAPLNLTDDFKHNLTVAMRLSGTKDETL